MLKGYAENGDTRALQVNVMFLGRNNCNYWQIGRNKENYEESILGGCLKKPANTHLEFWGNIKPI